jgi:hypothetical protein
MKPADAYSALYAVAGTPLRLWMQSNRPAFDAAVREGVAAAERGRLRRPTSFVDDEPRAVSEASLDRYRPGMILWSDRDGGTRAVLVSEYGKGRWLLEPSEQRVGDAEIAAAGLWQVVQYGPGWGRLHAKTVYIDLDGTGRKVYQARPPTHTLKRYEKEYKAYQRAKAAGKDAQLPRLPAVYFVEHKGVQYTLVPDNYLRSEDALSWRTVGEPQATRRAEAQKRADRRVLSPEAARVLEALVFDTLPYPAPYRQRGFSLATIQSDLVENRRNVFDRMSSGRYDEPWAEGVTFTADDNALLSQASHSKRLSERLIERALRTLMANGWVDKTGDGYVRREGRGLNAADRRDLESRYYVASRLLDRANMRYQYGTDEYIALREQRNALRASWNAAQHPLAGHDAAAAFAIAETNAALAAERLLAGE